MNSIGKRFLLQQTSSKLKQFAACTPINSLECSRRSYAMDARGSTPSKLSGAVRTTGQKESVWTEYIQLAADYNPVNLGQGFPDFHASPEHVRKALAEAALGDNPLLHQYTRGFGHPRLVKALATLYTKLINRPVNAMNEILVTCGAYEALYCIFLGHVNVGDEVIIIEPFFDCYEPMALAAGGVPVFVPLRLKPGVDSGSDRSSSQDWVLDRDELASKFNAKTKMIVINTPNNPIGKVFTEDELRFIADLCKKHNVIALMDEVYEWIIYKGNKHVRMASFSDMWERTITVGSVGKTFSLTGWKLGWAYGPESLMQPLKIIHQNSVYTCSTPQQEAVAVAFEKEIELLGQPESYFNQMSAMLEAKRDRMSNFLAGVGMKPTVPDGGYFMIADFSELANHVDFSSETDATRDYRFTKWLSKNKKLQGIPPSAFYGEQNKLLAENLIRFCFIKRDETLSQAEKIVNELKESLPS
ncbi:Kynurenine--oxoglutarate transaminase 3 [Halotydeus destructor]|nr:Kynurenine--oxoglutarate transaminase 3 [Halotydeus destructor]